MAWQPEPSTVDIAVESDRLVLTGRFKMAVADLVKRWCRSLGMEWCLTIHNDDVHLTFGRDGELEKTHAHFSAWLAVHTFRNRYTEIGEGTLCSLMVAGPDGETDYASLVANPVEGVTV